MAGGFGDSFGQFWAMVSLVSQSDCISPNDADVFDDGVGGISSNNADVFDNDLGGIIWVLHSDMIYDIESPHTIQRVNAASVKKFLGVLGIDVLLQFNWS